MREVEVNDSSTSKYIYNTTNRNFWKSTICYYYCELQRTCLLNEGKTNVELEWWVCKYDTWHYLVGPIISHDPKVDYFRANNGHEVTKIVCRL